MDPSHKAAAALGILHSIKHTHLGGWGVCVCVRGERQERSCFTAPQTYQPQPPSGCLPREESSGLLRTACGGTAETLNTTPPEPSLASPPQRAHGEKRRLQARALKLLALNTNAHICFAEATTRLCQLKRRGSTDRSFSQSRDDVSQGRQRLVDVLGFVQHGSFCSSFADLFVTKKLTKH